MEFAGLKVGVNVDIQRTDGKRKCQILHAFSQFYNRFTIKYKIFEFIILYCHIYR